MSFHKIFDRSSDEAMCKHMGEEVDVKDLKKTPKIEARVLRQLLKPLAFLHFNRHNLRPQN